MVGDAAYGCPARLVLMPASISLLLIECVARAEGSQGAVQNTPIFRSATKIRSKLLYIRKTGFVGKRMIH